MWPKPKEFSHGNTNLWLSPEVSLKIQVTEILDDSFASLWIDRPTPEPTTQHLIQKHDLDPKTVLTNAFQRLKTALFEQPPFVPDKFFPRTTSFEPTLEDHKTVIKEVEILLGAKDAASQFPEAYILNVTAEGGVRIEAPSYLGGLHALTSLQQLFYAHSSSQRDVYLRTAPIQIKDAPSFAHRGLNLDISRNRIFPEDVLQTLTGLSFCKMNRLHIHATDSQSWPLDIPSLPEIAAKGAYHPNQVWTEKDLSMVQRYGAERGIEVYLEIDMPGHMGAVYHSHPELTVGYGLKWDSYAVEPPAGQLKLVKPEVREFIKKVLEDLLPRSTPYSTLFHIGMDELNLNAYTLDPDIKSNSQEVIQPHLQDFLSGVFDTLKSHGVTPVAWEELVLDWDLSIPKDTIIQTWRTGEALTKVLEKGHKALFGAATHWYLDTGLGSFLDPDPANPDSTVKPPYHDWLPPYKNFKLMLSYDPLAGVPRELQAGVLGGETHLWGELVDSVNLDGMLWPRAAAAAEVLWAGKGTVEENSTRSLAEWRERLVLAGIRASMVQMEWILKNKGGGLL